MKEHYVRCPSGHVTAYEASVPKACPQCESRDLQILIERKVRD